jgi:hypothetical protein
MNDPDSGAGWHLIPLFVKWEVVGKFSSIRRRAFARLMKSIMDLLRPDFIYVTLSQGDDGITGRDHRIFDLPRNLMIISACGHGHIPMLLHVGLPDGDIRPEDYPITEKYEFDTVFAGNFGSHALRLKMGSIIWRESRKLGLRFGFPGKVENWKEWYLKSKFIMVPRGLGRSSYRMAEVLQMGMVPVYVYTDIPWIPYYDSINWSSFAIVTSISRFSEWCKFMKECPVEQVNAMRQKARSLMESHFSYDAIWRQLRNFLRHGFGGSDLRCAPFLPEDGHVKEPEEGEVDRFSVYRNR